MSELNDLLVQPALSNGEGGRSQSPPAASGSGSSKRYSKTGRANRACDPCARVKMRCEGSDAPPCGRCSRQGYNCTFVAADARLSGKKRSLTDSAARGDLERDLPRRLSPPGLNDHLQDPANYPTMSNSGVPHLLSNLLASTSGSQPFHISPSSSASTGSTSAHSGGRTTYDSAPAHTRQPSTDFVTRPSNPSNSDSQTFSPFNRPHRENTTSVNQLSDPLGLLVAVSLDVQKNPEDAANGDREGAKKSAGANLSQRPSRSGSPGREGTDQESGEHKSDLYFRPKGSNVTLKRRKTQPAAYNILSPAQIQEMFDLFYNLLHVHMPLVDKDHGTAEQIAGRSHFLFHSILGVTLRYWNGPRDAQERLLHLITEELKLFPTERTLECVQANLICATWNPVAPRHMELDEQYLRVGLAVRLAMDLRLHETDTSAVVDVPDWVLRSQRRTWAMCFIFDSKLAAHRNRMCTTPDMGLVGLERDGSPDDRRILSSVEWCRIIAQICDRRQKLASQTLPSSDSDAQSQWAHCAAIDVQLVQWKDRWSSTFPDVPGTSLQTLMARTRLYFYYAQILNYANSLQITEQGSDLRESVAAIKYFDTINRLLYTFVEDFGFYRIAAYLSDLHFTYVAFTAVSLIHSIVIGVGCKANNNSSTLKLLSRVADLFESSAGTYGHNLRNQAHFIRTLMKAKLDEQGNPRPDHVLQLDSDMFGVEDNVADWTLDLSYAEQMDPWGFGVPVSHETQSLEMFLNSNSVLNNPQMFEPGLWGSMFASRQSSPEFEGVLPT